MDCILNCKNFQVLGEYCTYQDETVAEYKAYCSDGIIRHYSISAYSCDPRDGARYSDYQEEIPTWITRDGESLKPSQMTSSHRANVVKILKQRLQQATEEIEIAKFQCYLAAFDIHAKSKAEGR